MQSQQIVWIIFTAVTSVGVLLQAFILLGMYFALKKTTDRVHELSGELKQHLVPTISAARTLVEDVSPKVSVITSNLVDASGTLKTQAHQINRTVSEISDMTHAKAVRVDEMANAVLDGLTHATAAVQHGITTPLKQVNGVLHGIRVGFDTLRRKEPTSL